MNSPRILIVGHSHTEVIAAALRARGRDDMTIVNLNSRDRKKSLKDKIAEGGYLPVIEEFDLVVSMIGGNFYNVFGLIENPMRFDFFEPGEEEYDPEPDRHLITYELIYRYFSDAMNSGFLRSLAVLREHSRGRIVHVTPPPPISDDSHILNNPGGYFRDKVQLGVAPARLRRKLYNLHQRVFDEFCAREGVPVLPPPAGTVADGFLERQFWKNDPTHANTPYGERVVEQIREFAAC